MTKKLILFILLLASIFIFTTPNINIYAAEIGPWGYWTDPGNIAKSAPRFDPMERTYRIGNAEELAWLASQVNQGYSFREFTFIITKDIDLSAHYWVPIGSSYEKAFEGIFDGNNKTISHVKIGAAESPDNKSKYVGFIGYGNHSGDQIGIKNLYLEDVSVYSSRADASVGGLAGSFDNIVNCGVEGTVTAAFGSDAGVLAGVATVDSCFASGSLKVTYNNMGLGGNMGGLLGMGSALNSYATVNVVLDDVFLNPIGYTITTNAGGLIGQGDAANCYATGNITGNGSTCGGLVGISYNLENCFTTGNVSGDAYSGGLVGLLDCDSTAQGYWNIDALQSGDGINYDNRLKLGVGKGSTDHDIYALRGTQQSLDVTDLKGNPIKFKEGVNKTVSKAAVEMKSTDFVNLLNSYVNGNKTYKTWKLKPGVNNDYPVLDGVGAGMDATSSEAPASANAGSTQKAVPSSTSVLVNGKKISFDAYIINGNNYFKLRDIAMAVKGTNKQFDVKWDSAGNIINLLSNRPYSPVGGELSLSKDRVTKDAQLTTSRICLDGKDISLTVYSIGGNNYFKLRDIAKSVDYGISWDGKTNTINIDTSSHYTE